MATDAHGSPRHARSLRADMKALLQVSFAMIVLAFSVAVLFCALLGDILRLHSCDVLLDFVLRTFAWVRSALGR